MRVGVTSVLFLLPFLAAAQQVGFRMASAWPVGKNNEPGKPHKQVEYLDTGGKPMSELGADHRREISCRDSIAGAIREFYPSGQLMDFALYASLPDYLLHGIHLRYYDNGQIHTSETYTAGKLNGERMMYYENGSVMRRDVYVDDTLSVGESFLPNGSPGPKGYTEAPPCYETSNEFREVVRAIQKNVVYPREAMIADEQGVVIITFDVITSGDIANTKVLQSASASLDQAALNAVHSLHRFAAPGTKCGRPVKVKMTAPVTFKITTAK